MILWGVLGLVTAGMAAFIVFAPEPEPRIVSRPAENVQASIGGPFTLTDADGETFSSLSLAGRPHAVFFGFTNCPDVCPTTLARLVRLREELGTDAFDIVFITVDPERDGPDEVGKYAALFDTPIIGLTGSPEQIDKVKEQYGVYSEKSGDDPAAYNVDHTATVFLMDGEGNFVSTIAQEEAREPALAKLRRIAA
ncbi:SCO family protein [Sphingomicrobium sp. B8]|uniref:SCO family protein n=2 Tax=Sphingomicrobium clamense TaxID=2851013 RepID=A0ABS6V7K0_9SPHN|nr:SCO family protein [Sphingomicrobium sp. B8]